MRLEKLFVELPDLDKIKEERSWDEIKAEFDYLAITGNESDADSQFADPGFQPDKKKRYPCDTERHIRAAWSYIHMPRNSSKYTSEQLAHIKRKIINRWKTVIDSKGPPSAK